MNVLLRSASVLALFAAALVASAQTTVFYGGDVSGNALLSERNGQRYPLASTVYDDFTLASATTVSGLFGNFRVNGGTMLGLGYEIRQGMSEGNGGTLLFSGTTTEFAQAGSRYSGSVSGVTLGPGTYHLGLFGLMDGNGDAFLYSTTGTNGVGSPTGNGNAFINSAQFGYNYLSTGRFGSVYSDFSFGVIAQSNPTPEPSAFAALGLGAAAMLRRRKKA